MWRGKGAEEKNECFACEGRGRRGMGSEVGGRIRDRENGRGRD